MRITMTHLVLVALLLIAGSFSFLFLLWFWFWFWLVGPWRFYRLVFIRSGPVFALFIL